MTEMSTREMLERFAEAGLSVNKEMAKEIVKRKDAVPCIADMLKDERYWREIGDGWFAIHSIFLLSIIRTREAFDVFKWILRNKADDLEDWLTEDVPSLLFNFGKEYFDEIKELALDKDIDVFARLSAASAICAMGVTDESMREKVVEVCKKFLEDENEEFVCLLLPEAAEIKDEELFEMVKKKFRELPFAKRVTDMEDLTELHEGRSGIPEYEKCLRDPWEHFSEENLEELRRYNY